MKRNVCVQSVSVLEGGDEDHPPSSSPFIARAKSAVLFESREGAVPRNGKALARPLRGPRSLPFSKTGSVSRLFRRRFFPQATSVEWNDWRWQVRNRIQDVETLDRIIRLSEEEREGLSKSTAKFPVGITPYYAGLIDPVDPSQPLRRTFVPTRTGTRSSWR